MNEEEIFHQALAHSIPEERAAYLQQACANNPALRASVEALLRANVGATGFLDQPAPTLLVASDQTMSGPGTRIGPYKLLEQIGEGGMGTVYVAEQAQPVRRTVALKVIKAGMDTREVIARFEAERQALAMMNHPNVAKVLDGGATTAGRPYFVMELVKGTPITDFCDQQKLGTRERLQLFVTACQAVQHAHQKGLIHRDIKPGNILIEVHDVTAVPKVIDFGVAKAIGQQLTERTLYTGFGQMVGTPLYMSPEQAGHSSIDVDTRSDVYSLGVLLYELLTGTTPFDRETFSKVGFDEMRRIIREDEPLRPSQRVSTLEAKARSTVSGKRGIDERQFARLLAGELDWIVMKALEKDRQRRYESASAFASDVQRYLDDEPVEACPPSTVYRLRKFARRNKRALLTGICLTVAMVGIVMVPVAWRLARHGRDEAALRGIENALTATRTALEANDLPLAERRLAEAQAVLTAAEGSLPGPADAIEAVRTELTQRKLDSDDFARFLRLARDAQGKMVCESNRRVGGEQFAREALEIYGVRTVPDWTTQLDRRYLTAQEKQQVRETVYETLLTFAYSLVRWEGTEERARESLSILNTEEKHHALTKAFYWVRSRIHSQLGNASAAQSDQAKYVSTPATKPLDYYLPAQLMGFEGDPNAAIRALHAALQLQPDDFNSYTQLAYWSWKEKRYNEAIAYATCCIALRPALEAYLVRGNAHEEAGEIAAAEEDYLAAIAHAKPAQRVEAYHALVVFYELTKQLEKSRDAVAHLIAIGEPIVADLKATNAVRSWDAITSMCWLGRYLESAKAVPLLEEAYRLANEVLGPQDIFTHTVRAELGKAYARAGQHSLAVPRLEEALESSKVNGGDILGRTVLMTNLGVAYLEVGQTELAVPLLEQALEKRKEISGPDDQQTLKFMNNLANGYKQARKFELAVPLHEHALERRKATLGADHPETLNSMWNLASAYMEVGKFEVAAQLLEQVREKRQANLGPDHPEMLDVIGFLGKAYISAGQPALAIPMLEPLLEKRKAISGQDDPRTIRDKGLLAAAYMDTGQPALAVPLLEQALEKAEAISDPHIVRYMSHLGVAYLEVARFDDAGQVLRAAVEIGKDQKSKKMEGAAAAYAGSLFGLGRLLMQDEKPFDAEPILRECLLIREEFEADYGTTFNTKSLLGRSLLKQKKYVEAEPLLLGGYEGMQVRTPFRQSNRWLTDALECLVQLYEAWGQVDKVAEWKTKLILVKSVEPTAANKPND